MAGKLIIFSAPSGSGKSTIINFLLKQNLNPVSYTHLDVYKRQHQKYINGCIIKNYLRHSLPFYIRPYQIFCSTVIGSVSGFASCSNVVPKNNQIINRIIAITTPKTSSTFVFFRLMSILQY